jgi:plastocyanin
MPATAPKRAHRCVVVNIKAGNPTPIVDLDPVEVSKKYGDEVLWECDGGVDFQVIFDPADCPFGNNKFDKNNNHSGPAQGGPKTYKYTVKAGGGTLDPDTIVNP